MTTLLDQLQNEIDASDEVNVTFRETLYQLKTIVENHDIDYAILVVGGELSWLKPDTSKAERVRALELGLKLMKVCAPNSLTIAPLDFLLK